LELTAHRARLVPAVTLEAWHVAISLLHRVEQLANVLKRIVVRLDLLQRRFWQSRVLGFLALALVQRLPVESLRQVSVELPKLLQHDLLGRILAKESGPVVVTAHNPVRETHVSFERLRVAPQENLLRLGLKLLHEDAFVVSCVLNHILVQNLSSPGGVHAV